MEIGFEDEDISEMILLAQMKAQNDENGEEKIAGNKEISILANCVQPAHEGDAHVLQPRRTCFPAFCLPLSFRYCKA